MLRHSHRVPRAYSMLYAVHVLSSSWGDACTRDASGSHPVRAQMVAFWGFGIGAFVTASTVQTYITSRWATIRKVRRRQRRRQRRRSLA